jgi:hypothetical protein
MDTIGRLVFDRIRHKAESEDSGKHVATLPADFTCDDVRAEAKVTCRNWFCKIASVGLCTSGMQLSRHISKSASLHQPLSL